MASADIKKILKNQETIIKKLKEIHKEQIASFEEAKDVEEKEDEQLEELDKLEESINKKTKSSPLKKITYHDITKGFVGAFAGIVGHFAFMEGTHIAEHFTVLRASLIIIFSFLMLILFIYFTGFRKVEFVSKKFIPLRALTIFFTALITIVLVLGIFGYIDSHSHFEEIFKQVSAISILAMLGAGAADMIGE